MKRNKLSFIICLSLFLIYSSQLISSTRATTVGDTSFGVEVGDVLTWVVTYVNPEKPETTLGSKYQHTIHSIGASGGYLVVNVTTRGYNSETGVWGSATPPFSLVSFNATTKNFSIPPAYVGPMILPTPLNLTFIAEYGFNNFPGLSAAPIDTNELMVIIEIYPGTVYHHVFNSKGIATSITKMEDGVVLYIETLETAGSIIPFGMFFLIFTAITMITLVVIYKKRTIFVKKSL